MRPERQLQERLREALRRPESFIWPDERGAFDRFQRRRARLGRTIAAGAVLALVAVLAGAVLLPTLLPGRPAPPVGPVVPAGPVVRDPERGFEVPVPAGWTGRRVPFPSPSQELIVELVPEGEASPGTRRIVLGTQVLLPEQHPGLPPGEDPGGVDHREGGFFALDDRASPLGRGRRPDGRPYVWRTRLLPDEVGEYAIAWPFYCRTDRPCPEGNRWRVLTIYAGRSDDPAVRRQLRSVAQRVIDTVLPITNALPGGDPAQLDPALSPPRPAAPAAPVTTAGPQGRDRPYPPTQVVST
ncbi:MAG TPA: hypothetical protein VF880_04475 [Actinomycetes bacterium]|jgi:hypothetical protein